MPRSSPRTSDRLPVKETLLILNPVAGKGRAGKLLEQVSGLLPEILGDFTTRTSEYPGHAVELAARGRDEGFRRFISLGGDGTPFEILNGLCRAGPPEDEIELVMLPAGTGNSFLRDFTSLSAEEIIRAAGAGRHRRVDAGEFTFYQQTQLQKKYYLNILGLGLISDILELTNEKFKFLGPAGYSLAVLVRLFRGITNDIRLEIDGRQHTLRNSALVISNSKFTGGGMKIAPMADTADGRLDIIAFQEVSRRDIIRIFSQVFSGNHIRHPKVKVYSGRDIRVSSTPPLRVMADGELLGKTPLSLKVLPGFLKVLI